MKRILHILMCCLLLISISIPVELSAATVEISASGKVQTGATYKVDGLTYKVGKIATGNTKGAVTLLKGSNKNTVTIPASVTISGKTYYVTGIEKSAFSGYSKVRKIRILSTRITKVGNNAIRNIYFKAAIEVPSNKKNAYRNLFTSATGYRKTMKIQTNAWYQCEAYADKISRKYGINLHGVPVPKNKNMCGYTVSNNVSKDIMRVNLEYLEMCLKDYPETFFKDMKKKGVRQVHIYMASGLTGKGRDYVSRAAGITYRVGPEIYVVFDVNFLMGSYIAHEFFHVSENALEIAGKYNAFSKWNTLNPRGFQYRENYSQYQKLDEKYVYIHGKTNYKNYWFMSSYGKMNEREDRATIFENMIYSDDDSYRSPHIKAKATYLESVFKKEFPNWFKNGRSIWRK